ncbi:MAG TPA: response regulator transcription factor [Vicinamibacteria bacterium]
MRPVRILVVDDHPVVRDGLRLMLETQHTMQVVAEASSGEEALKVYAQHQPDVVVMDLRLPGMSGAQTAAALQREHPQARVIILTSYGQEAEIEAALKAGARAYLRKDADRSQLLDAIRTVSAGGRYLPASIRECLAERAPASELTRREIEVLERMAAGMTNKEIGAALSISEDTVKIHAKNLFGKLDVNDRAHAVAVAARRGLLRLE